MWVENLHPRDEYGRFRLTGASGRWDKLAGGLEAHASAMAINEWEANQDRQSHFAALRDAGKLTPEQDAEWDRLGARAALIRDAIPKAYWKGYRPYGDGTWRDPDQPRAAYDDRGRRIPDLVLQGFVRVGDHPERVVLKRGERAPEHGGAVRGDDSPLAGGVWHRPGEYLPGRVPRLVNDWGIRLSRLEPVTARSRRHREREGAFVRAESRAEQFGAHRAAPHSTRNEPASTLASAEIQGAFMISPTNPVGRRRSARKKRDRQQTVTWIQRLSDRMEGR